MYESFLQSQAWQEFQEAVGRLTLRVDGALFVQQSACLAGPYFYAPRCNPNLVSNNLPVLIQRVLDQLPATSHPPAFIRIEPDQPVLFKDISEREREVKKIRSKNVKLGLIYAGSVQPRKSLWLDLSKTPEELLAGFKSKTRYNIRLAERKKLEIKFESRYHKPSWEKFWQLLEQTSKRNRFRTYDKKYYQKMLEVLSGSKMIYLGLASFKKHTLAGMLLITHQQEAVYLHGASSNEMKNLMAPYLLHWRAINLAKGLKLARYDFWGIDTAQNLKTDLTGEGVTRFKVGFGGEIVEYPGAFDYPINKLRYQAYRSLRKIKTTLKPNKFTD